ncbi:hypothetical protein LCGC14_2246390 [marine sediment metagenome]|uniref:Uncharacterized protein n=1 Tax=marine sediment metagenome TaxID=412755 RepID=A0A0F9D465_9ZZZZ
MLILAVGGIGRKECTHKSHVASVVREENATTKMVTH